MMNISQYCKQTWFVVLMVFAIGCSAVSHAFSQPMHALMGNTLNQSTHCMQMNDPTQHQSQTVHGEYHQATDTQHQMAKHIVSPLSTCQVGDADYASSMQSCADCSAAYCQVSNLAVTHQAITLTEPTVSSISDRLLSHYQAQNLLGFRQEILRPPRA